MVVVWGNRKGAVIILLMVKNTICFGLEDLAIPSDTVLAFRKLTLRSQFLFKTSMMYVTLKTSNKQQ